MIFRRYAGFLATMLTVLTLPAGVPVSANASYPERQITLICASGAGGAVDVITRVLADHMSRTLGRSIVVQNEPGAGSTLAIRSVAKASPDGYTLLSIGSGVSVVSELYPQAGVDVLRDLQPISIVGITPQDLVTHPSVPATDYASLVHHLKAHPKELTSGSNGRGTSGHLALELFNQMAGVEVRYIPYRTSPQAQTDLLSGVLSMMVTSTMTSYVNSGAVRPIAVTILKRWDVMPDVPTFDELGLKGFESVSFTSMFAPKGTPPEIVERVNLAIKAALADPALRARLSHAGVLPPDGAGPVYTEKYLRHEMKKWGDLLRSLN